MSQIFSLLGLDGDFDHIRAGLKKYGIAMLRDDSANCGWRLERHNPDPNASN